jgi:PAS domain S-box-containing protein
MVFRDITERRRIERERIASERAARELAAIVESSDDAIIAMRLDGTMTAWNRAAERMYGYTSSEAMGQSIQLVIPDDRWAEELAYLDRVQVGEGVEHVETVRRRKDGSELPVSLTMSPVRDASGAIVGASKIARDITGRKQIEAERAALLTREHAARLELERASRLKDEFLAILSHELRTPLNAVLGYAHLLGSDALPPDRSRHAIDAIRRNAQAQARLVESLLDLSRILAGKLELDRRPHNLADIINAALDVIRPDGDAKGVSIETLEPLSPVVVTADATRLQQVFWNLLSNGVKFTPRGGRVTVESRPCGDAVMIEVRDTGQGIPAEFLPQIFDRFKQAVGGNQARAGLGLGLAVVREMVQAHGGTIVAESAGEGRGSTFRLTLPAAVAKRDDQAAPSELAADDGSLADLDILIVDDDGDARDLLALIVESRGACPRVADSTAAALELIRERWPNVLLADVRMPDEDGYALIRHVRGQENGSGRLPAIAVTANATADDRGRATAAGYDLHLTKPVDAADLTQAIARLTRAHRV